MTKLISLSGNMGSGKDTIAAMINDARPEAQSYAFADHLKQISIEIFGLSHEQVHGDKKEIEFKKPILLSAALIMEIKNWVVLRNSNYMLVDIEELKNMALRGETTFKTPRKVMQYLGTEILRDHFSKTYHIDQVMKRIKDEQPEIAIITDARFPNERTFMKEQGATTVLITGRTRDDFKEGGFYKHASESEMGSPEDYSFWVDNTGTLAELRNKVIDELLQTFDKLNQVSLV